nr:MAG: hypothetical protein [Bacteriophage sp.]
MKGELINCSKQLMFCSALMIVNQYLLKWGLDNMEIHWVIAKYTFLVSTWIVIGVIALLALVNIIQLIERYSVNYTPEKDIMFPLVLSISKLFGITGLILWL